MENIVKYLKRSQSQCSMNNSIKVIQGHNANIKPETDLKIFIPFILPQ